MRLFIALCIFTFVTGETSHLGSSLSPCSAEVDGKFYDLTPISDHIIHLAGSVGDDFSYRLKVCGDVSCPDADSPSPSSGFALADAPPGQCVQVLGEWKDLQWRVRDIGGETGITAEVQNGAPCAESPTALTINFICDESAAVPNTGNTYKTNDPCPSYTMKIRTSAACATEKEGMGIFSIFLLTVLVTICVYLVVGVCGNYYYFGISPFSAEAIPNRDFWLEFPSLVQDGVIYTYTLVMRKCNNNGYTVSRDEGLPGDLTQDEIDSMQGDYGSQISQIDYNEI